MPRGNLVAITETIEAAKKLPKPTVEKPFYDFAESAVFTPTLPALMINPAWQLGELRQKLGVALANDHYIPKHPLRSCWCFSGCSQWAGKNFDDRGDRNLLSRARLVRCEKFPADLLNLANDQATHPSISGSFIDPVHRLMERVDLTRQLLEQPFYDGYHVVVSCHEGAAMALGARRLFSRTELSTAAQGSVYAKLCSP